jgi:hypothetical protein
MKDVKFTAEGIYVGKVNETDVNKGDGNMVNLVDFIINNQIADSKGTIKEQPLKITAYNKNAVLLDAVRVGDKIVVSGYIRGKYNVSKDEYWTNLVMRTIRLV